MGTCLPPSTGLPWQPALWRWPLAVCLLSLLCWIIDERLAWGEGDGAVCCAFKAFSTFLSAYSTLIFLSGFYVYMGKMLSYVWKMIYGRNARFLFGICICGKGSLMSFLMRTLHSSCNNLFALVPFPHLSFKDNIVLGFRAPILCVHVLCSPSLPLASVNAPSQRQHQMKVLVWHGKGCTRALGLGHIFRGRWLLLEIQKTRLC